MSIGVQSYPELYTMLLGWGLYEKLWLLLTQTGIAYLPFIGIILRNITDSYTTHDAGAQALRSMEINLITTILLIFFAVSPCIPLNAHAISYTPMCGINKDKTVFPGDTGTTYDKAFAVPTENIHVPMWWYAVISVSEGMTHAANTMVGCVPDLRKMVTQVDTTQISDPEIKQQLQDFEIMCYMPARTQFNQDKQKNNSILVSCTDIIVVDSVDEIKEQSILVMNGLKNMMMTYPDKKEKIKKIIDLLEDNKIDLLTSLVI